MSLTPGKPCSGLLILFWAWMTPQKHAEKRKHKVRSRYLSSSSEEDQSSVPIQRSSNPSRAPLDQDQPQHDPDPLFYMEVAIADIPLNMLKKWRPLGIFLISLTPGKPCPGLLLLFWAWNDQKGQQELRPGGPSTILPLSSIIKDALDKFEQDFLASNLPEGKYIKPPSFPSKVVQGVPALYWGQNPRVKYTLLEDLYLS